MIQRIQTLFLLAAIVALVVCLCLPIGAFEPKGMGVMPLWYNLGIVNNGVMKFYVVPFILLAFAVIVALIDIFMALKKEEMKQILKKQMKVCNLSIVFCLAWYVYYIIAALSTFQTLGSFRLKFAACLPLIAIVFFVLARHGMKADDELLRSEDRIR